MAIAFDAASSAYTSGAHTSKTWAHTCTGSNLVLFVNISTYSSGGTTQVSGITYAGSAMTFHDTQAITTVVNTDLYYMYAPTTGANNIVASFASQVNDWCSAASYTGAKQSAFPDASAKGVGSGTSITGTVTTTVDNCWVIMAGHSNASGTSAGTDTTIRATSPTEGRSTISDGQNAVTPAGSSSVVINQSNDWRVHIVVSLAPYVVGPANVKTCNGIAMASVKTIDGVAMASVKTKNGIA